MERGKLLKVIDTPFQVPLGDDLFGSIRKNNIDQVGGRLQPCYGVFTFVVLLGYLYTGHASLLGAVI